MEQALRAGGALRVVGMDEVGVGSWCGAVVAAAVLLPSELTELEGVRDSKALSPAQRERAFKVIRSTAVRVGIGAASVAEIDQLNIYEATHLAMRRALAKIGGHDHVLLDGNPIRGFEQHIGPYTAVVGGDAKSLSIAAASVVAKVTRDRLMARLARCHPQYGWERNAGYGSPQHQQALAEHGVTGFHRRSYAPIRLLLEQAAALERSPLA